MPAGVASSDTPTGLIPIHPTPLQYHQAEAERTSECGICQEDMEGGKDDHDESIHTTKSYRVVCHGG